MQTLLTPDLCVIGAGAGGLSVAAAASQLGAKVVLVEKGAMGGDCLNTGCVPSKALLAVAKRAQQVRMAGRLGLTANLGDISPQAVHNHVQAVIRDIAPNDSEARFTGLGVQVIRAEGQFLDKRHLRAGEYDIAARRFVIATGSVPALPPIPGLTTVPFHTNETLFQIAEPIPHLLIIGAGPVGLEMAQAFRRLGSQVTVVEAARPLAREDPELVAVVLRRLQAEGIRILTETHVARLQGQAGAIQAEVTTPEGRETLSATHLFVATGRKPDVSALNLEAAGIRHSENGITVSRGLVTSNRRVFAIGDVIGGAQFTHVANYHAGIVIRRALFRLPAKLSRKGVPRVIFTDPELAYVGATETELRDNIKKLRLLRWPYMENDRARAEGETEGFVKVIADKRGRILGAGIVGAQAGELIQVWALAMQQGLTLKALTETITPYPTLAEINRRVSLAFYLPRLTSETTRRLVGWLARLG